MVYLFGYKSLKNDATKDSPRKIVSPLQLIINKPSIGFIKDYIQLP